MSGEEIEALLARVKERIIREAEKACCAREGLEEPIEVETMEELMEYIENCGAVILTFYTPTCPYCRAFKPVYAMVSEEYPRLPFLRVNAWILPEAAQLFGVMGVPMTIGIARGRPTAVIYGYAEPDMVEELVERTTREASCSAGSGEED